MPAKSPEEICHLFQQHMAEGDLDSVLRLCSKISCPFQISEKQAKTGRKSHFVRQSGQLIFEQSLSVYDPEAVFLNRSREVKKGEALRQELAPFAAVKATFDFNIKQVIQSDDIALMHTEWKISSPEPISVYAIEVARRQPDGAWRWLIGDPFTVDKQAAS